MACSLPDLHFFVLHRKKQIRFFLANFIKSENLQRHLYLIAGPDFEGRETATPGQRKAAAYIEDYFKSLGLKPGNKDSFQYSYPVFKDSFISSNIRVNGQEFELNRDYQNRSLSKSFSFSYGLSDVVFAGYGLSDSLRDDYKGLNVSGKIVMVLGWFSSRICAGANHRKNFNGFAKVRMLPWQHGAVAILSSRKIFHAINR